MTIDLSEYTLEELQEIINGASHEQARRQTRDRLRGDFEKVIDDARAGGSARKPVDYEEWQKPRDITEAYKNGERVTDKGKSYVSRITPNVCIPGECLTGWEEEKDPEPDEQDDDGED